MKSRDHRQHIVHMGYSRDGRAGARYSGSNASERQVARLLFGDDLCGFSGGSERGGGQLRYFIALPHSAGHWSSQTAEEAPA